MTTNRVVAKEGPNPWAAVSESSKPVVEKNTLSRIKFGIDAEIEKALSMYSKDELRLSKVYWPRAFRSLTTYILKSLLKKPEIWNDLRSPSFDFNGEEVQRLIDELNFPSSPHIKVKQRRWMIHILREVSLFRGKFGLGVRLPNSCGESMDWPCDLEDKDDLCSSMTHLSLRDDARRFLWKILDEVIPPGRYCNMHYFGAVKSSEKLPIVMEVTEDYLEDVRNRIATVSDHLRASNHENLLPVDVVDITGVPLTIVTATKCLSCLISRSTLLCTTCSSPQNT